MSTEYSYIVCHDFSDQLRESLWKYDIQVSDSFSRFSSLVPRPSPLSAHYTRASFAHADSYAHGNCPHAQNSPAYNERLAGKAWEQGKILHTSSMFICLSALVSKKGMPYSSATVLPPKGNMNDPYMDEEVVWLLRNRVIMSNILFTAALHTHGPDVHIITHVLFKIEIAQIRPDSFPSCGPGYDIGLL